MVTWFWQRPRTGERALALRSRGDVGDATRVDFEEHTIYYCPTCQTGGRTLKDRRLSRLLR